MDRRMQQAFIIGLLTTVFVWLQGCSDSANSPENGRPAIVADSIQTEGEEFQQFLSSFPLARFPFTLNRAQIESFATYPDVLPDQMKYFSGPSEFSIGIGKAHFGKVVRFEGSDEFQLVLVKRSGQPEPGTFAESFELYSMRRDGKPIGHLELAYYHGDRKGHVIQTAEIDADGRIIQEMQMAKYDSASGNVENSATVKYFRQITPEGEFKNLKAEN